MAYYIDNSVVIQHAISNTDLILKFLSDNGVNTNIQYNDMEEVDDNYILMFLHHLTNDNFSNVITIYNEQIIINPTYNKKVENITTQVFNFLNTLPILVRDNKIKEIINGVE